MGGFLGIGGSSYKTDRKTELGGFSDLHNVFNFALPFAQSSAATGTATTKAGTDAMSSSLGYWQKLMSGNRTTMQQAVAPETNATLSGADAQKRQLAATGTARGGGVAGVEQQQKDATMAKVDNLLFGARPEAAKESSKIGGDLARVGTSQTSNAINALGLGEETAANITGIAAKSRVDSQAINQDMVGKVTNFIDQALTMAFA